MISTDDAISDEPIRGLVPTSAERGRQYKRLKTSATLNRGMETSVTVRDSVIGNRFTRAVDMSLNMALGIPGGEPGLLGAVTMAVTRALATACAPTGVIHGVIHEVVNEAIRAACAPTGVIHEVINEAVRASEQRSMARMRNAKVYDGAALVHALMDKNGQIPQHFPATYTDFVNMSVDDADSLLLAYGLPRGGNRMAKVFRISAFCNMNLPI